MKKRIKCLFIGNSHTYVNYLPNYVKQYAEKDDIECENVMICHGGWFLSQHINEPETNFNILYGGYDYIILQEHGHPLPPKEEYISSVSKLADMARSVGAVPVLYGTWAHREKTDEQDERLKIEKEVIQKTGCLPALVGERWFKYRNEDPLHDVYAEDGGHASERGTSYAAKIIWDTILIDLSSKNNH